MLHRWFTTSGSPLVALVFNFLAVLPCIAMNDGAAWIRSARATDVRCCAVEGPALAPRVLIKGSTLMQRAAAGDFDLESLSSWVAVFPLRVAHKLEVFISAADTGAGEPYESNSLSLVGNVDAGSMQTAVPAYTAAAFFAVVAFSVQAQLKLEQERVQFLEEEESQLKQRQAELESSLAQAVRDADARAQALEALVARVRTARQAADQQVDARQAPIEAFDRDVAQQFERLATLFDATASSFPQQVAQAQASLTEAREKVLGFNTTQTELEDYLATRQPNEIGLSQEMSTYVSAVRSTWELRQVEQRKQTALSQLVLLTETLNNLTAAQKREREKFERQREQLASRLQRKRDALVDEVDAEALTTARAVAAVLAQIDSAS